MRYTSLGMTARLRRDADLTKNFGGDFEGTQARGVIVDLAGRYDFIGLRFGEKLLETTTDCLRRTDGGVARALIDRGAFDRSAKIVDGIDGRWKFSGTAAHQTQELQLRGTEQAICFLIGLSGKNAGADDHAGFVELRRRLKIPPVKMERDFEILGREM